MYLGDLPIAILKNGKTNEPANQGIYYVYSDHLNTPRVITDSTDNQIVWRWDLTDPFGASQPIDTVQGQSKFSYNLRFPGQYYDKETNLHYNYFRDYDPQTGRYVQSDPIGMSGGINTYAYDSHSSRRTSVLQNGTPVFKSEKSNIGIDCAQY